MYGRFLGRSTHASNIGRIPKYGFTTNDPDAQMVEDSKYEPGTHATPINVIGLQMHSKMVRMGRLYRPIVDVFGYTEGGESIVVRVVGPKPKYYCKVPAGYSPIDFLEETIAALETAERLSDEDITTNIYYGQDSSYCSFLRPQAFIVLESYNISHLRYSKEVMLTLYSEKKAEIAYTELDTPSMVIHREREGFPLRFSETISVGEYGYHVMLQTGLSLIGHLQINNYVSGDGSDRYKAKRYIECSTNYIIQAEERVNLLEHALIASYDLETDNLAPRVRKISSRTKDPIITIGVAFFRALDTIPLLSVAFYYTNKPSSRVENTLLVRCDTEAEMLISFAELISIMNTDIILTFNGDIFDNNYLYVRSKLNRCDDFYRTTLSRYVSPTRWEKVMFRSNLTSKGDGIITTGLSRYITDNRCFFDARLYYQARYPKVFGERGSLNDMLEYFNVQDPHNIAFAGELRSPPVLADAEVRSSPVRDSITPTMEAGGERREDGDERSSARSARDERRSAPMTKMALSIERMYAYWRAADGYIEAGEEERLDLKFKVSEILKYCVQDCYSTHLLIYATGVIYDLFARAATSYTTMGDSMHRADGLRVTRSVAKYAWAMDMLLTDETPSYDWRKYPKVRIGGGAVESFMPGHHLYITAMDFTSQYPAQKEAKNIDTVTKVPSEAIDFPEAYGIEIVDRSTIVDCYGERERFVIRLIDFEIPEEDIYTHVDGLQNLFENFIRYARGREFVVEQFWAEESRFDPLENPYPVRYKTYYLQSPRGPDSRPCEHYSIKEVMLTHLRSLRIEYKGEMKRQARRLKTLEEGTAEYYMCRNEMQRYDGKQGGVKVQMNTEYGVTVTDVYALFDPETGATVTWCSRTLIGFLRSCLELGYLILSNEIVEDPKFERVFAFYNACCPDLPIVLEECGREHISREDGSLLMDADTMLRDRPRTTTWYRLMYPTAEIVYQDTDSNYFKCEAITSVFAEIESTRRRSLHCIRALNAYNAVVRMAIVLLINRPPIGLGFEGAFTIAYYWAQKKRYIGISVEEKPDTIDDIRMDVCFDGYTRNTDISRFLKKCGVKVTGVEIIRRETPVYIIQALFRFLQRLLSPVPPESMQTVAIEILEDFLGRFDRYTLEELSSKQKYAPGKKNRIFHIINRMELFIANVRSEAERASSEASARALAEGLSEEEAEAAGVSAASRWVDLRREKEKLLPREFQVIRFVVCKAISPLEHSYIIRDAHGIPQPSLSDRTYLLDEVRNEALGIEVDPAYYHMYLANKLAPFLCQEISPVEYNNILNITDKHTKTMKLKQMQSKIAMRLHGRHFTAPGAARMFSTFYNRNLDKVIPVIIPPRQAKTVHSLMRSIGRIDSTLEDACRRLLAKEKKRFRERPNAAMRVQIEEYSHWPKRELDLGISEVKPAAERYELQYIALYVDVMSRLHVIDVELCRSIIALRRRGEDMLTDDMLSRITSIEEISSLVIDRLTAAKAKFANTYRRLISMRVARSSLGFIGFHGVSF